MKKVGREDEAVNVQEAARSLGRPTPEVQAALHDLGIPVRSPEAPLDGPSLLRLSGLFLDRGWTPRTVLYLDAYNIYWVARHAYGAPPDFARIPELLEGEDLPWLARAFLPNNGRANGLEAALRRMGFRVQAKAGKVREDGLKANFDVEIAVDAVDDLHRFRPQAVYLVSGDGDFTYLVRYLREAGCRVTVAAFPEGLARTLRDAADRVVVLDQYYTRPRPDGPIGQKGMPRCLCSLWA